MIIYVDENMPPQLARGFNILQGPLNSESRESIEVISLRDKFPEGTLDEDWIPVAGEEGACAITQDYNIQKTRHQRELYQKHGLGIFFFKSSSKKGLRYIDMLKLLSKHWEEITKIATRERRPFAFRITQRGGMEDISD